MIVMNNRLLLLTLSTALAATTALAARQAPPAAAPAGRPAAAAPAPAAQTPAPGAPAPGAAQGRGGPQPSPFTTPPLRIFLYAGLKTHGEGQHDYPQFLADWSKLLMMRNAVVDGALHFPSAKELASADVLVIYKGDAGYLSMEDRANLDAYVRRGGGLVSLHDALCGPDPADFATHRRRRQEARRGQLHARSERRLHDRRSPRTRSCRACRTSRSRTRRSTS